MNWYFFLNTLLNDDFNLLKNGSGINILMALD